MIFLQWKKHHKPSATNSHYTVSVYFWSRNYTPFMTVPHTQIPILRNVEVERELQSVWWLNAKVNVTRMRSVWYSNQSDNQIRVYEALQCIPNTCILNINAVIRRSNQVKAIRIRYKDWQRNQQNMLALKNDSKTIACFVEGTKYVHMYYHDIYIWTSMECFAYICNLKICYPQD
jgi:hypothetical protein